MTSPSPDTISIPSSKQSTFDVEVIVKMYTVEHLTMRQIAEKVGCSPATVGAKLKGAGVDSKQGEWVESRCDNCQVQFNTPRCRAKKSERSYCSQECYFSARATTDYKQNRQGQRIARKVVSKYFDLPPGSIVHHEDGDNHNNDPFNLRAFASQSDHLKYHHGINDVIPIWDGRTVQSVA